MSKTNKTRREKAIKSLMLLISVAVISVTLSIGFFVSVLLMNSRVSALQTELRSIQAEIAKVEAENEQKVDQFVMYSSQLEYELGQKEAEIEDLNDLITYRPPNYSSGKIAYLTFDDGPSALTAQVLDILAQYDVKATFFIKGTAIKHYPETLARMAEEGHTLGNHSLTHKYEDVYSSLDALIAEIEETNKRIYEASGVQPVAFRFPGGSSNSMFAKYSPSVEIDSWLTLIHQMGMEYYDWNVSSLDASSTKKSAAEIVAAVKKGCQNLSQVTILMHDAGDKNTTVEALPQIIEYLLSEGYTIKPITTDSKPIQHRTASQS